MNKARFFQISLLVLAFLAVASQFRSSKGILGPQPAEVNREETRQEVQPAPSSPQAESETASAVGGVQDLRGFILENAVRIEKVDDIAVQQQLDEEIKIRAQSLSGVEVMHAVQVAADDDETQSSRLLAFELIAESKYAPKGISQVLAFLAQLPRIPALPHSMAEAKQGFNRALKITGLLRLEQLATGKNKVAIREHFENVVRSERDPHVIFLAQLGLKGLKQNKPMLERFADQMEFSGEQ